MLPLHLFELRKKLLLGNDALINQQLSQGIGLDGVCDQKFLEGTSSDWSSFSAISVPIWIKREVYSARPGYHAPPHTHGGIDDPPSYIVSY